MVAMSEAGRSRSGPLTTYGERFERCSVLTHSRASLPSLKTMAAGGAGAWFTAIAGPFPISSVSNLV